MAIFGVGSDYKGIITIYADGVPVDADGIYADFDILLDFYTTSERKKKTAYRVADEFFNCGYVTQDGIVKLYCTFDDVQWGSGEVMCKATYIYTDADFEDGKRSIVQYIETGDSYDRL